MDNSNVKVYVKVNAEFMPNGLLVPRVLTWEDGREYSIDRVLDLRPSPTMKCGGQGDRYTIRIRGRDSYLYFERNERFGEITLGRWFVECKGA